MREQQRAVLIAEGQARIAERNGAIAHQRLESTVKLAISFTGLPDSNYTVTSDGCYLEKQESQAT